MIKKRNRSIVVITIFVLVISLIPSMAFGAAKTVKAVRGVDAEQASNTSVDLEWAMSTGQRVTRFTDPLKRRENTP